MAAFVLRDCKVSINGTTNDISQFVKSVTIDASRSEHDNTTMGATGKTRHTGLTDGSVSIDLVDDFASSAIDSLLWSFFNTGSNIEMRVRVTSAAISATNPEYRFDIAPTSYGFGGAIDTQAEKSVSFPISGAITRATST